MNDTTKPIVGFIGLGTMGGPMASHLQKAGYQIVIHEVRREMAADHLKAGAIWADTPRDLAKQCSVMFTCLPNLEAIEKVATGPDGLVTGIRRGDAFFELSTGSPELAKRLHAAFAEVGAHMLDAPISGGGGGAKLGRLAMYVGGDKAVYERYEPVLRAMADRPIHIGPIGTGLVTKLVHNCASQCIQASIAEIFALGVKAGAEPLSLWKALRQGAVGRRRTFDVLVDQYLPNKYEVAQAAVRIVYKDMVLATELAREVNMPMRIANLAFADLQEAMLRGWSERDSRSVMLLPQERCGVTVEVEPAAIQEVLRDDPAAPTDTRYGKG